MTPGAFDMLLTGARLFGPLAALFAFAILALGVAGAGVGFAAGLAFALALTLHALVFGADAARTAFPPWIARALLGLGVIGAAIAPTVPQFDFAAQLGEGGLFIATASGAGLVLMTCMGRAPTLRDADW